MSSITMTICLDDAITHRLEQLAKIMESTKSFLITKAIKDYLDIHEWQIREIQQGIEEADRGELVSHEEVKKLLG